jgi:predicted phage terminase large subunit-like protein
MTFDVLWPEKYSCYDLALMYYSDPRGFKSEIMNDASKIGEKIFHQIKTLSKEEIESLEYIKTIMVIDPAVEIGDRIDYTAICAGSKIANGFRYIRKGIIEKYKFDDYIQKVIDLLIEYPEISYLWIEKNTYNGTDEREIRKRIREDDTLVKRNIKIESQRQFKNKHNKICSIAGKVDSGFFVFNEEDLDFTNQILDYNEFAKHDDAPDVLAEFDRLIDEVNQIFKLEFLDKRLLF